MAKALLILFGGRIIPNVLTILHEKPDIIVPIVPDDEREIARLNKFKEGVDRLLEKKKRKKGIDYNWLDESRGTFTVHPFDKDNIKERIKAVCKTLAKNEPEQEVNKESEQEPNYEWIFNITSGTSIMSIAAYEAAKELEASGIDIQCWYLNTANTQVEVLLGKPRDIDSKSLFIIYIDDYAEVYNKKLEIKKVGDTLPPEEERLKFAQFLIPSYAYTSALSLMLVKGNESNSSVKYQMDEKKKENKKENKKQEYYTCFRLSNNRNETDVLKKIAECSLIRNLVKTTSHWSFEINDQQFHFLNGGWLELYVSTEIRKINDVDGNPLFQDIQTNRTVHNMNEQSFIKQEANELDVSMMCNGQLFIIECKAGEDAKKSDTIFRLDSVATAFGGDFVGKYLVTSLSEDEVKKQNDNNQANFQERLEIRKIVLITFEKLKDLRSIFFKEGTNPTYSRI